MRGNLEEVLFAVEEEEEEEEEEEVGGAQSTGGASIAEIIAACEEADRNFDANELENASDEDETAFEEGHWEGNEEDDDLERASGFMKLPEK